MLGTKNLSGDGEPAFRLNLQFHAYLSSSYVGDSALGVN